MGTLLGGPALLQQALRPAPAVRERVEVIRKPTAADRELLRARPTGRRPAMFQTWSRLAFLHWSFDPEDLRPLVPPDLALDTWEGRAWVGIVPFEMRRVRPRGLPAVPWLSTFLELNLRTYVYDAEGRPGVWFFSLDCSQPVAVALARRFFFLPYFHATMRERQEEGFIDYGCRRRGSEEEWAYRYRARGPERLAEPGTLEYFLVERYLLFSRDPRRGRLHLGQVHHEPYRIHDAEVPVWDAGVFALDGLPCPSGPPEHALFSPGVNVEIFGLRSAD